MRFGLCCALGLAVLATPMVTRADTFNFSATGAGFESSGTLLGTLSSPGVYDVTSISGEVNGVAITGLIPGSYDVNNPTNNSNGDFFFDNLLYSGSPVLDGAGLGVDVGTGGYQVNFFYNSTPPLNVPNSYWLWTSDNNTNFALNSFTVTPAPTPEPSALLLLGTGVLGLVGAMRRRLAA